MPSLGEGPRGASARRGEHRHCRLVARTPAVTAHVEPTRPPARALQVGDRVAASLFRDGWLDEAGPLDHAPSPLNCCVRLSRSGRSTRSNWLGASPASAWAGSFPSTSTSSTARRMRRRRPSTSDTRALGVAGTGAFASVLARASLGGQFAHGAQEHDASPPSMAR